MSTERGMNETQETALAKAFAESPSPATCVALGEHHLSAKSAKRAAELAKEGLARWPEDRAVRLLFAKALLARGKTRACSRELALLLTENPKDVEALTLLGRTLLETGQSEEAWVVLRRALKVAPRELMVKALLSEAAAAIRRQQDQAAESIVVREPDGRVVELSPPEASPAGFTGYIKALSFQTPDSNAEESADFSPSVIIAPDYRDQIPSAVVEPTLPTQPGAGPHPSTGAITQESFSPGVQARLSLGGRLSLSGRGSLREIGQDTKPFDAPQLDDRTAEQAPLAFEDPEDWPLAHVSPDEAPGASAEEAPNLVADASLGPSESESLPPDDEDDEDPTAAVDPAELLQIGVALDERASLSPAPDASDERRAFTASLDLQGQPINRRSLLLEPHARTVESAVPSLRPSFDLLFEGQALDEDDPRLAQTRQLAHFGDLLDLKPPAQELPTAQEPTRPLEGLEALFGQPAPIDEDEPPTPTEEHGPNTVHLPKRRVDEPRKVELLDSIPSISSLPPPSLGAIPPVPKRAPARFEAPSSKPPAPKAPDPPKARIEPLKPDPPKEARPEPAKRADLQKAPPPLPKAASQAPPPPVDLLDIPFDPAEFEDLPAKPRPVATHEIPRDLVDELGPVAARGRVFAPAESEVKLPPPPALPPPEPARPPRPMIKPAEPAPRPRDPLAARLEGFGAPTVQGLPVSGRSGGHRRLAMVGGLCLILLFLLIAVLTHRCESQDESEQLSQARALLGEDAYAARLQAQAKLEGGGDKPFYTLPGELLARLLGSEGLDGLARQRHALLARLLAERVARFGDKAQESAADSALERAEAEAPDELDTAIAGFYLKVWRRQWALARGRLDGLPEAARNTGEIQYAYARLALAEGRREQAITHARTAAQLSPELIPALKLLADIKATRQDLSALADFDALSAAHPSHLETQIASARLKIKLNKNAPLAAQALEQLLSERAADLSPNQRAAALDGIGQQAARTRDEAKARASFQAAAEAAPGDPRYSAGLAELLVQSRRLAEARPLLVKTFESEPAEPEHRIRLARLELLAGEPLAALDLLRGLTDPEPDALILAAQAHLDAGDNREAEAALSEAARFDPNRSDLKLLKSLAGALTGTPRQAELALAQLEALAKTEQVQDDPALAFRALAKVYLARQDLPRAQAQLSRALVIDPEDDRSYLALCRLKAEQGLAAAALAACQDALKRNPHLRPAVELAARLAEANEDFGAVVSLISPFVEARPEGALVRQLARALVKLGHQDALAALDTPALDASSRAYLAALTAERAGKLTEARALLKPALDALPDDVWLRLTQGELLLKAGQPEAALRHFQKALELDPQAARPALGAARAELEQNHLDEAAKLARQASQARLEPPRIRAEALVVVGLASLAAPHGEAAAKRALDDALDLEPELAPALVGLGRLAELKGEATEAASFYRRATRVAPKSPEAFYRLGSLLFDSPNPKPGLQHLEQAVALDPEGQWGLRAKQKLR